MKRGQAESVPQTGSRRMLKAPLSYRNVEERSIISRTNADLFVVVAPTAADIICNAASGGDGRYY